MHIHTWCPRHEHIEMHEGMAIHIEIQMRNGICIYIHGALGMNTYKCMRAWPYILKYKCVMVYAYTYMVS